MRMILLAATAAMALCACQKKAEAPPADNSSMDMNAADTNAADMNAAAPAAMTTLNETSWEYTDPDTKKPVIESIDAKGDYITQGKDGSHVDHGTAVMKEGKACFTSKMDKKGELCWTDPMLAVGQSGETTSDKGQKLTVTRVEYKALTM